MRPLSATEAISPALQRTKLVLFRPFRVGRTWKLCATSYLTICGQIFVPFHLAYLAFAPTIGRSFGHTAEALFCIALLAATLPFLWIFYLCSRLKFAWFDIVVNRGQFVAPAWRKYGPPAWRWTGFKVALGCTFCAVVSLPVIAYVRHLMPILLSLNTHPGSQPPMQLIAAIFAGYGLMIFLFGIISIISGLLGDFIVPSLALEDTSIGEAFRRMFALMRNEPGEFTLYALLKTLLGVAGYIGTMIISEIAIMIVVGVVWIVFALCGVLLHLAGIPSQVLMVLGMIVGGALEMFLIMYVMMLGIGPVLTFLDAYAVYFLGGRYPMLGDLLDRSELAPLYPYPAAYPPTPYPPPQPETVPPPAPLPDEAG